MTANEITDVIERLKTHDGDKRAIGAAIKAMLRLRLSCWAVDDIVTMKLQRDTNRIHARYLSQLIEANNVELNNMFRDSRVQP